MAPEASYCLNCECKSDQEECRICISLNYKCKGTCRCCAESRLQNVENRISARMRNRAENVCLRCDCLGDGRPCNKCNNCGFSCPGSCACCVPTKIIVKIPILATGITVPSTGKVCSACTCIRGRAPCNKCSVFKCTGDCDCCVKTKITVKAQANNENKTGISQRKRKLKNTTEVSCSNKETKEIVEDNSDDECSACSCVRGRELCKSCSTWNFKCPGGCDCCVKSTSVKSKAVKKSKTVLQDKPEVSNTNTTMLVKEENTDDKPEVSNMNTRMLVKEENTDEVW